MSEVAEVAKAEMQSSDKNFSTILKELLKSGFLVASCSGVGCFTIGPAGGFLGAAAAALLQVLKWESGALNLAKCVDNPIVRLVLFYLDMKLISLCAEKLGNLLLRLCRFITEKTRKTQIPAITHNAGAY